jgi:hypothetical protein
MRGLPPGHRKSTHLRWQHARYLTCHQYCSKACETANRSIHEHDCKSPLSQQHWLPSWAEEGREPTFLINDGESMNTDFGTNKYLWGNMPSIDVIRLGVNEGETYEQDLKILFVGTRAGHHLMILLLIINFLT